MSTELAPNELPDPVVALVTSRRERAEDRRERLTGALAEIREMDSELAAARAEIIQLRQQLAEAHAMIAFVDKRCGDLDRDRMTYAKQAVSLARSLRSVWHLTNEAHRMAEAADALGVPEAAEGAS